MNTTPTVKGDDRRFSRIPFEATTQLHIHPAQESHPAHLLDISLKGALLESMQPPGSTLQGKNCRMILELGQGDERIVMEGRVVHHDGQLIGIECRHIDVDSMANLRRLMELNTGDSALLEREMAEMLKANAAP